jgi:dTDP-4-amino-4,6-dideoxy-D-galactose acyltransferase
MISETICQYLEWDSAFFRRKIARVSANRLHQEDMTCALAWCEMHAIDCLYFLADADDALSTRMVEEHCFNLMDVRMTLELRSLDTLPDADLRPCIRLCAPDDAPALRAIARLGHRDSRFYYDPHFPEAMCDALYEIWIEKSCAGAADAVLVAQDQGQPAGYIACHLDQHHGGQIGLVGVAEAARGRGIGRALVAESLRWFAVHGARQVSVVTQGRNVQAQRLYQHCGFLTRSVQLWYHRWFSHDEGQVAR